MELKADFTGIPKSLKMPTVYTSLEEARTILNTRCVDSYEDEYGIVENPTVREMILHLWAYCEIAGETIPSALKKMDSGEIDGTILKTKISHILFFLEKSDEFT